MWRRGKPAYDTKTRATLALTILITTSLFFRLSPPADADTEASIDLFTQKVPFGGRGINQSSDMFDPQETVILYAEVLENGNPLEGLLVTFEIIEPEASLYGTGSYRTARTNASGIAEIQFSLRVMCQDEAIGVWAVDATVRVNGKICRDFLTFRAYWTVELLTVRTVDENPLNSTGFPPSRQFFGENGYVGIEIALRNNAMIRKNANIAVSLIDELGTTVNYTLAEDWALPPSGKIAYFFDTIALPKHTAPGKAKVFVSAFDGNQIAYCPEISAGFLITVNNPVFPKFKDISIVYAEAYPAIVEPGGKVDVTIMLRNEGTVALNNISVTVSVNDSLIAQLDALSLDSYGYRFLTIQWAAIGFPEGKYEILVRVPVLPEEADVTDNDCTIAFEIKVAEKHDVAITNVVASPSAGYVGDNVRIAVEMANLGNSVEGFNVVAYANNSEIAVGRVEFLGVGQTMVLYFMWDTSNVQEGTYVIRSVADAVPGEISVENNFFTDGQVQLLLRPGPSRRDIAVIALSANPILVNVGRSVTIMTVVSNLGDQPESFDLTLLYDSSIIQIIPVVSLPSDSQRTVEYVWNTTDVRPGMYRLSASVTFLEGEVNTENNSLEDSCVTIQGINVQFAFLCFMASTLILILLASLVLLLLLGCLRRRKKKMSRHLHCVIVHNHV